MLKIPCLVLDHDDTVVQSEATVNYPFFCHILDQFRPGTTISLEKYVDGCCNLGFSDMCRQWYGFTEQELVDEYLGWQEYIKDHIPLPYPGIGDIIRRQKEAGGLICVVSHSCIQNISRDYETHFGILPDEIFGWDLPEDKCKPSPWPLECIIAKYNLRPDQLLVVDDMKPAYEMARKAGVPIAFAAWGRMDYPEIVRDMEACCDYTFYSTGQLEKFLFDKGEKMRLEHGNICIRTAVAEDAEQLTAWWNDGSVMAHAGFPLGLGTTVAEVTQKLLDTTYNGERLILEWNSTAIGEMCYRDMVNGGVDIGIKICNPDFQEKGIGRVALSMLIRYLFEIGFTKIVLDTNLKNLRAQHVYEKLGFQKTAVMMDYWKNQVGEMESAVAYELTEDTFVDFS